MVRSRDRCLLLRFTMLLGLVRGCSSEPEGDQGCLRKLVKSFLIWTKQLVYTQLFELYLRILYEASAKRGGSSAARMGR